MTQIWIVRHGEAAASWEKDPDPGLSNLGQLQAEETATALTNIVPLGAHLISSPLRRAQRLQLRLLASAAMLFESIRDFPKCDRLYR